MIFLYIFVSSKVQKNRPNHHKMKNLKHHLKDEKAIKLIYILYYYYFFFYKFSMSRENEDEVLWLHRFHKINVNISFAIIDFGLKEFAYYYFYFIAL